MTTLGVMPACNYPPSEQAHTGTLHIDFVEMLFALAAAEVAVKAGEFADSGILMKSPFEWHSLAVLFHLLLAMVLIAASWVGWGGSAFAARDSKLSGMFTIDFLELLLDVTIVVFYFVLAHSVEYDKDKKVITPSAYGEAWGIALVMCSYLVWDVMSKIRYLWTGGTKRYVLFTRGWVSALCAFISIAIFWLPIKDNDKLGTVLWVDGCLLGLIVLFRALKYLLDRREVRGWVFATGSILLMLVCSLGARRSGRNPVTPVSALPTKIETASPNQEDGLQRSLSKLKQFPDFKYLPPPDEYQGPLFNLMSCFSWNWKVVPVGLA